MQSQLPLSVQWALNRLSSCGYEAYAVGGCVRDMLLGREPHDWDVCTSASPQEVTRCFADVRVLATGIRHGTVTALLNDQPVEITTYRVDGEYTDHRRPASVRYTASLREDLARRDFTINAMAFTPEGGIIDYFGGQEDLRAGIIRCVGVPQKRFAEDALRILRALRFATRYSFAIERETADALLACRDDLKLIAVERVLAELVGIDYSRLDARYLPVLQAVVPELRRLDVPASLPPDPAIRLAALLHGLDGVDILRRLKASTELTDRVGLLIRHYDDPVEAEDTIIRRLLRRMGPDATRQLLRLRQAQEALPCLEAILRRGDAYAVRQLQVNGNDLKAIGFRGKQIGAALEQLLTKVIDGELPNERDKLVKAAGIWAVLYGIGAEESPGFV